MLGPPYVQGRDRAQRQYRGVDSPEKYADEHVQQLSEVSCTLHATRKL